MRAAGSSSSSPTATGFWRRRRRLARGAAAQDGADPRDHLGGAERLDDVVVGAELEADDLVHLGPARGQHHDRHVGAATQLAADVAAVAVGKRQVEHHQVGLARGRPAPAPRRRSPVTSGSKPARRSASANGWEIDSSSSTTRMRPPGAWLVIRHCRAISALPGRPPQVLPALYPPLSGAWKGLFAQCAPQPRARREHREERESKIAAGATVVVLGGLGGLALSQGNRPPSQQVADKPVVRTKVIRRTIHVTKHAKPKHPPAGSGTGASAA